MLGIMLVALSAQYFKQENLDALQKNATNAAGAKRTPAAAPAQKLHSELMLSNAFWH